MAESYGFFDSSESDKREYSASIFSEYFSKFFQTGLLNGLGVSPEGNNMKINVGIGFANILGYFYKNDTAYELSIDSADSSYIRIDRIVIRLDLVARTIKTIIKKGVAASSPITPTLQRDLTVYELSLARINIPPGTMSLTNAMIIDERFDAAVCGLATATVRPLIVSSTVQPNNLISGDIWIQYLG